MTIRPRRSVLYMPGSNARALEKAKTLPADALILDLEDAVAPDAKATAREPGDARGARPAASAGARCSCASTALDTAWWQATISPPPPSRPGRHPGAEGVDARRQLIATWRRVRRRARRRTRSGSGR